MSTNREMLNKRDIADILITIGNEVQHGRRCIIDILYLVINNSFNVERKCTGKCEKCILAWLDEPAVVLPVKKEEK